MLIHLRRCHFVPFCSSTSNAFPIPLRLARPTENSHIRIGSPRSAKNIRYITIKAAPPYIPHMYGNFHTLPSPTAHPADTSIKPNLEANFSLLSFIVIYTFLLLLNRHIILMPALTCNYQTYIFNMLLPVT